MKKIALDYYKHSKYCGSYLIKDEYKAVIEERKQKSRRDKLEKEKLEKNQREEGCVYYGDIIVVKDIDTKEIFDLPALERDPKSEKVKQVLKAFFGTKIKSFAVFNGCRYRVIPIKYSKHR